LNLSRSPIATPCQMIALGGESGALQYNVAVHKKPRQSGS
jgi:hypothetical protein